MRVLEKLKVFVPPIEEQQEIIEFIDEKYNKANQLISIKEQKIEKLNQYKKSVIYEYVTGKKEA